MASTYGNDLRLEEIGDGEQSGTWGATTNTNLELIAEALSFGTEAITTNYCRWGYRPRTLSVFEIYRDARQHLHYYNSA